MCAGINSNLSMWNVAFLNNSAGFAGGAMHLSNAMHIVPGEPFTNITVVGNSVGAFAAGANIYGGAAFAKPKLDNSECSSFADMWRNRFCLFACANPDKAAESIYATVL